MNNKEVEEQHAEMTDKVNQILKGKPDDFQIEDYKFVAVGYLDITEPPYEVGEVPAGFVEKLRSLFHNGTMIATMGHHDCEFCLNQGVKKLPKDARSSYEKTLRDEVNKIKYQFPEMIFHYINVHKFKPSEEFIWFVMRS